MGERPDLSFEFEEAPELPGSDRLSKYLFGGIRGISGRLWDFQIEGRDNVPLDGPALITPNHLSFCDSVFVPAALPRRVWAIGKGEYMDSWKTKHLFPAMGMIPVDRSGGDAAKAALDTAAKVLSGGHLFMIYPEGTRSRSGNLHKGRTGAARLAIRCNAPIVPAGHEGTLEVQPPDSALMKTRKKVVVRFGKPMWAHEFGDPDDPRTLRVFTDAVMFEISQLSGQAYVDEYAGKSAPAAEQPDGTTPPSHPDEHQHVTPTRPSIIGGDTPTVPRPPTRPMGSIGTRPSISGNGSAPKAVAVPPGRKVPAS